MLNLDEMERAGERMAEGWFQMRWLIKSVGNPIIDFLEQIENFQRMLWVSFAYGVWVMMA